MNPIGIHSTPPPWPLISGRKAHHWQAFSYYWLFIWEVPLYHTSMAMSRGCVCEQIANLGGASLDWRLRKLASGAKARSN